MLAAKKHLSSDPEYYTKSYGVFCQKSNLEQTKDEWFRDGLPYVLKPLLSRWQTESLPECRVLAIGSADGKFDFAILEAITNGFAKTNPTKLSLFNRVVEPSSSSIDGFKAAAAEWSKTREEDVEANFELIQGTFQEYAPKQREAGRFQFIHLLSSIYYMNAEEALCHLIEKELATNGAILLLTFAENSFWIRFARRFHDTGVCPSPPGFTFYTSEHLVSIAKKHNWHCEMHRMRYWFDATELFDESNENGSLLADFLTHTINFRGVTEKAKRDAVTRFWEEEAEKEEDGRRLMWSDNAMVLIYK